MGSVSNATVCWGATFALRGERLRSNSFRTKDSTADRIGIWIGDPLSGLSIGCSTAATKSETTLARVGRCCGSDGTDAAAVAVTAVDVVTADVSASAEDGAKECLVGTSALAALLNVCDCCRPGRAECPAATATAESTWSAASERAIPRELADRLDVR